MNNELLKLFEGEAVSCEKINGCCDHLFKDSNLSKVFTLEDKEKNILKSTNQVGFGIICGKTVVILPKIFRENKKTEGNECFLDFLAMLNIYLNLKLKEQEYSSLRESKEKPNILLHQIIIYLFSTELERQLISGLDREYTRYLLESPNMKGRLLLTKQLRKPRYKQHILSLRKYIRTEDTILNRIFKKTIEEALEHAKWKISVERLSFLQWYFRNVSNLEYDRVRGLINKVSLNRLNERFSVALTLAKIILLGFHEKPSLGTNIGFFIESEDLFEKIVYTALRQELSNEYEIGYQEGFWFADIYSNDTVNVGNIKAVPDFIVKRKNERIVLDAKYKEIREQYKDREEVKIKYRPENSDLYQLFIYSKKYAEKYEVKGGLIYPLYKNFNKKAMEDWKDLSIRVSIDNKKTTLKLFFLDIENLKKRKYLFTPDLLGEIREKS